MTQKILEPSNDAAQKFDGESQWMSEYKREFTWKTPMIPSLFPEIKTEAIQTMPVRTVDDSIQTQPVALSSVTVLDETVKDTSPTNIQTVTLLSEPVLTSTKPAITRTIATTAVQTAIEPETTISPSVQTTTRPKPTTLDSRPTSGSRSRSPMMTYGYGNTKPVVPDHYLKTFNVNAPKGQLYPFTKERGLRTKEFLTNVLEPSQSLQNGVSSFQRTQSRSSDRGKIAQGTTMNQNGSVTDRNLSTRTSPTPSVSSTKQKDVLALYLQARKEVERLQQRFKTEYATQYRDWYHEQIPSIEPMNTQIEGSNKTLSRTSKAAVSHNVPPWKTRPAGLPSSYVPHNHDGKQYLEKRDPDGELRLLGPPWSNIYHAWSADTHGKRHHDNTTQTKPATIPIVQPKLESTTHAMADIPAAGVPDTVAFKHNEKRHYDVEYKSTDEDVFPHVPPVSVKPIRDSAGIPTPRISRHKEKRHYDIEYKSTEEDIFPNATSPKVAWADELNPNVQVDTKKSDTIISPKASPASSSPTKAKDPAIPSPTKSSPQSPETKEKIVQFAVEPPQTWTLAQDLLARAKQKELEQQQSPDSSISSPEKEKSPVALDSA